MITHFDEDKPIYLQIAESIEDAILSGAFEEESQVPSTTEISVKFKINPATALKGVNVLVENDILYKKRGLGMFVKQGAVEKIRNQRKLAFYHRYVETLLSEAQKLGLSREEVVTMIERGFEQ